MHLILHGGGSECHLGELELCYTDDDRRDLFFAPTLGLGLAISTVD